MIDSTNLPRPAVLAPVLLLVLYAIYNIFFKPSVVPKGLPILGAKKGDWYPLLQASWRNTRDLKTSLLSGYEHYKDQPVLLPLFGSEDIVLLPSSDTQFVADQPDHMLNMHEQSIESLAIDYTCTDPYLIHNPVHNKLIVTTLTNQIGNLVPDVADETSWGFSQQWGDDATQFKEICVYDTMRRIIGNVTNRVFVGLPKCRDPALLDAGMAFAQDVPVSSIAIRLVPTLLRPLLAPLITRPNKLHTRQWEQVLIPEIERRLREYDARNADPEGKSVGAEPNDFLQWSIKQAKESGDPYMWKSQTLAGRILLLNFAAIHTSSFSITNAILDLVGSKPEYISELREEIQSVLAEHNGQWNKRALAKMEKLDSVMRESARLNSFVTIGLARKVTAKDGILTPSGLRVPKGGRVAVPSYPVLHDDTVYTDADTFNPFRFSEQRSDENIEYVQRARKAFATTSNEYLAFGHGKNACPGRFFAANELKLMLAHLVVNYDFEMQDSRPRNMWFGLNRIPPMAAKIKIRKREKI